MSRDEQEERRSRPRIQGPIPATVRSTDINGQSFEVEAALDNLSIGGLHVRLERQVNPEVSMLAMIRFAGMEIEATGTVKRVDPQADGSFGFGVAFHGYRILSAQ